jgi:adenylate cyclase
MVAGMLALAAGLGFMILESRVDFIQAVYAQGFDRVSGLFAREQPLDAIVIADVDEASLRELGQWPWPRRLLARLVRRLAEDGASVAAFDILFPEPDRASPERAIAEWKSLGVKGSEMLASAGVEADFDAELAQAMAAVPCVLGCSLELEGGGAPALEGYRQRIFETAFNAGDGYLSRRFIPGAKGIVASIPPLTRAAAGTAFVNTTPDSDRIIRRTPLVKSVGGVLYPSLSLEAVRLALGASGVKVIYDRASQGVDAVAFSKPRLVATDPTARLILNFRAARHRHVSAADILAGRTPPGFFRGKIVLIGTSAAGLRDLVAIPGETEFPGVDVHAVAIDNLLCGDPYREAPWSFAACLAAALLGGLLLVWVTSTRRFAWSLTLLLLLLAGSLALSMAAAARERLIVSPVPCAVTWFAAYLASAAVRFRGEEKGRRQVRSLFGTMVSDQVLRYMEQHPGSVSLTGRRCEVTCLFTDVAGFTSIAERLDPETLSRMMNAFLTPLTDIILAEGGFVNKYIGDAIMAVWGIPYAMPDHAERACRAALACQRELARLRPQLKEEFGADLFMRIGLETGVVTAGNMGSSRRFEYTVMGDTVNRASRFEGLCKEFGAAIIIGARLQAAVGNAFKTRGLGTVTVKGKTEAVEVFELVDEPNP